MNTITLQEKTDSLPVHIGISPEKREKVAKVLSSFLASTYMLYLKTLYYHWNIVGPNFVGLHELFEKQYNELHKAGDDLAERVRALGSFTPGTFHQFIELSQIKDDKELPSNMQDMINNLLVSHEICSNHARSVLEVAESVKDEVTIDMMVARMTSHEKAAWMLRSILQ